MASSGHGEMNIANQLTFDAVVTLRSILDKTPALSLYVRAGEHTSITDVVDGEYEVLYRVGEGWTGVDFARLVGASRAIEMMAEGRNLDMAEAERLGIVNRILEAATADEFLARALEYARGFCPPAKASRAVGLIKRAVRSGSPQ